MQGNVMQARNALHGRAGFSGAERLSIMVAEDCARFSLRLLPELRERAGACFDCELPARIGGVSASGPRTALCLGPDEWFLLAPAGEAEVIGERFAQDLPQPHSLVDVSHRELGIEIRGSASELTLSAISALDLSAMRAGSATRTILDKAQVVLLKRAADSYRIEVWQSFASHVWGLLETVSHEIALDI